MDCSGFNLLLFGYINLRFLMPASCDFYSNDYVAFFKTRQQVEMRIWDYCFYPITVFVD